MDLSLTTRTVHVPNREWLADGQNHTAFGGTLDASTFTESKHYPDGYFVDGIVLALITANGLWGPYTAAGSGGLQTARGILFSPIPYTAADPSCPVMVQGFIKSGLLPTVGAMTEGHWDAAAAADIATGAHLILDVDFT